MADWCALSTERKQKTKKKYVLQDRHGALAISILRMKGQNLLRVISSMRLRRTQSICPGLIRPSLSGAHQWWHPIPAVKVLSRPPSGGSRIQQGGLLRWWLEPYEFELQARGHSAGPASQRGLRRGLCGRADCGNQALPLPKGCEQCLGG